MEKCFFVPQFLGSSPDWGEQTPRANSCSVTLTGPKAAVVSRYTVNDHLGQRRLRAGSQLEASSNTLYLPPSPRAHHRRAFSLVAGQPAQSIVGRACSALSLLLFPARCDSQVSQEAHNCHGQECSWLA